jgi:predicted house-cleaning NTP pyrophosphatase (Maf/HAM1 superfamily)
VQGRAAAFVTRIDGSYANVVGLPIADVVAALRSHGMTWMT